MASFRVSQAHPELFHYTNAEGLKGILTSQSLWGTNWRYLNDSTEVAYFCEALPSLLTPARMAACELFAREIPGFHAWADEQGGFRALVAKEVLGLTQTFRDSFAHPDPAEQMFEYYVTSFCTPEDSPPEVREHGLLSMWRSYAAGGYAIVFDTEELEALIRAEVGVWQAFMTFSDVGYGCDTPDVLEARISAIPKLREISSRSRLNSEEAFKELLDPLLH